MFNLIFRKERNSIFIRHGFTADDLQPAFTAKSIAAAEAINYYAGPGRGG